MPICKQCRGVGDQRVVAGQDTDEPCRHCGGTGREPTLIGEALSYADGPSVLMGLLRECQAALSGPADLRQRIEDVIGPRP